MNNTSFFTGLSALLILAVCSACSVFRDSARDDANQKLAESMKYTYPARMKQALSLGADPDTRDSDGVPVLIRAVVLQRPDQVSLLLHSGADVNIRDSENETALHAAVSGKNIDLVQSLIQAGADVNARSRDGRTPAMEACRLGRLEALKLLLASGADPDAVDSRGAPLASFAAMAPSNDAIAILRYLEDEKHLSSLAGEKELYTSPLLIAQDCRSEDVALYILKRLPDFDKAPELDPVAQVSIRIAIEQNQKKVFKELLRKNMQLNRTLPAVFQAAKFVNVPGVYKLLARNGIIDHGYTPVITACICARPDMVEKLIKAGADPFIESNEGKNAFSYANDAATADRLDDATKKLRNARIEEDAGGLEISKDPSMKRKLF